MSLLICLQAFPDLHSDAASATARDVYTSSAAAPHRRLPPRARLSVRTEAASETANEGTGANNATSTARIVRVSVAAAEADDAAAAARVWTVRLHLPRADSRVTRCVCVTHRIGAAAHTIANSNILADGDAAATMTTTGTGVDVVHHAPLAQDSDEAGAFFPLRGAGARPAPLAGAIAEATIKAGTHAVDVDFHIE